MNAHVDPRPGRLAVGLIAVDVARTLDEIMAAIALRGAIYVGEQECPLEEEYDGNDFSAASHLIVRVDGVVAGTLRIRWFADFAKVERAAVLPRFRTHALGARLLQYACDLAARRGYRRILGHAQARLVGFWERNAGLTARPGRPSFVFSDHEYVEVERRLTPPPGALSIDSDPLMLLRPDGAWDQPGVLDQSVARGATNPH